MGELKFPTKVNTKVSTRGLVSISKHKYIGGEYTRLDLWMTPFWNWAAGCLPLWLHPNAVTLLGTLGLVVGHCVWWFFSPNFDSYADSPPPYWVYLVSTFSMFWSQTMDAIDGKQARRTGASSPLGQLFDHGCDAFSVTLMAQMLASALDLGPTWMPGHFFCASAVMFWMSTVVEYHTGTLPTNDGSLGVTEAQFVVMGHQIVTMVWGPSFWRRDLLALLPFPVGLLGGVVTPLNISLLVTTGQMIKFLVVMTLRIREAYDTDNPPSGSPCDCKTPPAAEGEAKSPTPTLEETMWGHKTLGFGRALFHLSWVGWMTALMFLWTEAVRGLDGDVGRVWMGVRVVNSNVGVLFAWQTSKLIVSHMAEEPVPFVLKAWIPCVVGYVNTLYFNIYSCQFNAAILVWMVFWYSKYVMTVVTEIAGHLDIHCFSMEYLRKIS